MAFEGKFFAQILVCAKIIDLENYHPATPSEISGQEKDNYSLITKTGAGVINMAECFLLPSPSRTPILTSSTEKGACAEGQESSRGIPAGGAASLQRGPRAVSWETPLLNCMTNRKVLVSG